jgi:hypothetical protein
MGVLIFHPRLRGDKFSLFNLRERIYDMGRKEMEQGLKNIRTHERKNTGPEDFSSLRRQHRANWHVK